MLFEVWDEDSDPTKQYFPSLESFSDFDLLMQFFRRKKVYGILFFALFANVANLLIPEGDPFDVDNKSNHFNSATE